MDSACEIAVSIEDTEDRRLLRVEGPLDLSNAAPLLQALADSLAGAAGRIAVVDLAGLTAIDLCGMQLLCSAHRTFRARGSGLSLQAAPVWFRQSAAAAGFTMPTVACRLRCGNDCLWRTGECAG